MVVNSRTKPIKVKGLTLLAIDFAPLPDMNRFNEMTVKSELQELNVLLLKLHSLFHT